MLQARAHAHFDAGAQGTAGRCMAAKCQLLRAWQARSRRESIEGCVVARGQSWVIFMNKGDVYVRACLKGGEVEGGGAQEGGVVERRSVRRRRRNF